MILEQSLLAAAMIGLTVVIHASFMLGIETALRGTASAASGSLRKALGVAAVVLWLVVSISVQCWIWAALLLWLGALGSLEEAVYFVTVTYTTLGYGDIVLDERWRLLAAFAATNGTIIIGWTTALVFLVIQKLYLGRAAP